MITLTKKQRAAVKRKFDQNPDEAKTYRDFRKRITIGYDCVMLRWCGIWIGIETDGYTHS